MRKEIKVIALDLDGTLLTSDKTISAENKQAIQEAKAAGIKVVLCTGRPLKGIVNYLEELELMDDEDYAITYNGGLIQKNQSGEILYQKAHSKADMEYCYQETYQVGLPLVMIDLQYAYETTYPENRTSLYPGVMKAIPFQQANPSEFAEGHQFNKAVLCIDELILDEESKRLPAAFYERFTCVKSRKYLLEVLPKDVSKGSALEHLAELLGITTDNIMACGDEENDLSMLTTVGFPVAMENGTDEVKAVASFITHTNDQDGVAYAIRHILKQA